MLLPKTSLEISVADVVHAGTRVILCMSGVFSKVQGIDVRFGRPVPAIVASSKCCFVKQE